MDEFLMDYGFLIYLAFVLLGILIFLGIYYAVSRLIKFLKKYRHNRLLNSSEYFSLNPLLNTIYLSSEKSFYYF